MSEKENIAFDRKVREMMLDTEVTVPPGVWEGIMSRRAVAPVWRYAAWGLAVAAAVAVAFLFAGTIRKSPQTSPALVELVTPADGGTALAEAVVPDIPDAAPVAIPEGKNSPVICEFAPGKAETRPAEVDLQVSEVETHNSEKEAHPADAKVAPVGTDIPSVTPETPTVKTEGSAVEKEDGRRDDPFARMEMEDRLAERRVRAMSMDVHGVLSGNEGKAAGIAKMTSGTASLAQEHLEESSVSSFGVPLTIGAGVRFELAPRFTIGTGLDYSLLSRTYSAVYCQGNGVAGIDGDVRNIMHYLGVPLQLSYGFLDTGALSVYSYVGGKAEWCISDCSTFRAGDFTKTFNAAYGRPQLSVNLGLGAEYRITDGFGIYLDPSINYYFYSHQPKSIRTEKPFMFNLSIGIRFHVK